MTQPLALALPSIPPAGAALSPQDAQTLIETYRSWVATTGATLLNLEDAVIGNPESAADHTLAFVLWRGVDRAVEASSDSTHRPPERLASLRAPIADAVGTPVAANSAEAALMISALIDSIHQRNAAANQVVEASVAAGSVLTQCAPFVKSLAMYSQRHQALVGRSLSASTAEESSDVEREARQLLSELTAADRDRSTQLAAAAADKGRVESLRTLEQRARSVWERATEKVSGLPRRGIVSVDALGPAPAMPNLDDVPWPGVRELLSQRAARLDRAEQSLQQVIAVAEAALSERNELRQLLDAFRAQAMAAHVGEQPPVASAYDAAHSVLWAAPCDLASARSAVDRYRVELQRARGFAELHSGNTNNTETPASTGGTGNTDTPASKEPR